VGTIREVLGSTDPLAAAGDGVSFAAEDLTPGRLPAEASLFQAPDPDRLALIAHELRGPLAALGISVDLLLHDLEGLDHAEVRAILRVMARRVLWLQGLLENLLLTPSLRQGRLTLRPEPVNLVELCRDTGQLVEPLLAQRRQCLLVRWQGAPVTVWTDRRRLGQVLLNLLLNAHQHGPAETAITVTVSTHGPRFRIAVADQGPGLQGVPAARLFEPYFRAPGAASGGLGLGLAVVKAVAEAAGGAVGAENGPSGGACFWIELPIRLG
jgi:signal transduction histidine kinase